MEPWADWQERIEELDAGSFEVSQWEADFLAGLLEQQPATLSAKRVEVLENMCRKYGVS